MPVTVPVAIIPVPVPGPNPAISITVLPLTIPLAVIPVELAAPDHATVFYGRPGVEIVNPRKVVARGDNFWELWDRFWYRA